MRSRPVPVPAPSPFQRPSGTASGAAAPGRPAGLVAVPESGVSRGGKPAGNAQGSAASRAASTSTTSQEGLRIMSLSQVRTARSCRHSSKLWRTCGAGSWRTSSPCTTKLSAHCHAIATNDVRTGANFRCISRVTGRLGEGPHMLALSLFNGLCDGTAVDAGQRGDEQRGAGRRRAGVVQ